jgi:YidC/Oxa1 family membrane protein insertase
MVRMLLVPLTVRQIHSMQALQKHAPQMKEIQKKYKGDRQKMNEEMMRFYKENNINPAASCLPLLAQLPVFFSLYLVLRQFAKHPPAGDLSWLHIVPNMADKASAHWSGYLLLAIYAVSQIASTYFMSTTMEKTQRYLMMALPLFFITFLLNFPVGLVIYWVTTNLWTVGQGLVTRRLVPKTPASQIQRRSSRTPPKDEGDGGGNGAKTDGPEPKPAPSAQQQRPRQPQQVRRKKKGGARR